MRYTYTSRLVEREMFIWSLPIAQLPATLSRVHCVSLEEKNVFILEAAVVVVLSPKCYFLSKSAEHTCSPRCHSWLSRPCSKSPALDTRYSVRRSILGLSVCNGPRSVSGTETSWSHWVGRSLLEYLTCQSFDTKFCWWSRISRLRSTVMTCTACLGRHSTAWVNSIRQDIGNLCSRSQAKFGDNTGALVGAFEI